MFLGRSFQSRGIFSWSWDVELILRRTVLTKEDTLIDLCVGFRKPITDGIWQHVLDCFNGIKKSQKPNQYKHSSCKQFFLMPWNYNSLVCCTHSVSSRFLTGRNFLHFNISLKRKWYHHSFLCKPDLVYSMVFHMLYLVTSHTLVTLFLSLLTCWNGTPPFQWLVNI